MNRFPMKRCNPLTMQPARTQAQYLISNEWSTRPHRQRRRRETRLRASQRVNQHQQRKRVNWLRHLGRGALRILEQMIARAGRGFGRGLSLRGSHDSRAFDLEMGAYQQRLLESMIATQEERARDQVEQLDLETSESKATGATETLRFNPFAKK